MVGRGGPRELDQGSEPNEADPRSWWTQRDQASVGGSGVVDPGWTQRGVNLLGSSQRDRMEGGPMGD